MTNQENNVRLDRRFVTAPMALLLAITANAQSLMIENVTVIDGTGNEPMRNATVLVEDNRIKAVSPMAIPATEGTTRVDGRGKYLIPGLMDTHIHLAGGRKGMVTEGQRTLTMDLSTGVKTLHGYLYSGVTTVYDSGNHTDFIFRMRNDERTGKIVSPRIFATGAVVAFTGGYASGVGSTTIGSWNDIENLDRLLDREPDMVKFVLDPQGMVMNVLRPTFPPDLLKRLIQYCQTRGFRTTIHVASEKHALQAVDAGVNALAHVMVQGRINPSFAQFMASKGIPMSTTMTVYNNIARIAEEPEMFETRLFAATLDPSELEHQKTRERQRYIRSGMSAMFAMLMPYMKENIGHFYRAGAVLAAGTDRTYGPTLHQELETLVESGVSPADALRMATMNGARYLGKEDELGSITRGKLADMVLLRADPTVDIKNAQTIEAVYKGGVRIDLDQLKLPINRP